MLVKKRNHKQVRLLFIIIAIFILVLSSAVFFFVDHSNEGLDHDCLKANLRGTIAFKCACELYEGNQFEGIVEKYDNPMGKGAPDVIIIRLSESSDSIFFGENMVKTSLGRMIYATNYGKMFMQLRPGIAPEGIERGDYAKKTANSSQVIFSKHGRKLSFDLYKPFKAAFSSCTAIDQYIRQ